MDSNNSGNFEEGDDLSCSNSEDKSSINNEKFIKMLISK